MRESSSNKSAASSKSQHKHVRKAGTVTPQEDQSYLNLFESVIFTLVNNMKKFDFPVEKTKIEYRSVIFKGLQENLELKSNWKQANDESSYHLDGKTYRQKIQSFSKKSWNTTKNFLNDLKILGKELGSTTLQEAVDVGENLLAEKNVENLQEEKLALLEKQLEALQQYEKKSEEENKQLQEQLEQMQQRLKTMQEQLKDQTKLSTKDAATQVALANTELLQQQLDDLKEEKARVQQQLTNSQQQNTHLQQQLTDLQQQQNDLQKERDDSQQRNTHLQQQLDDLQQQQNDLQKERDDSQQQNTHLQQQLTDLQQQQNDLQKERDDSQQRNTHLQQQLDDLQQQQNDLQKERDDSQQRNTHLQQQLTDLQQQQNDLQKESDTETEVKVVATSELLQQQQSITATEEPTTQRQEHYRKAIAKIQKYIDTRKKERGKKKSEYNSSFARLWKAEHKKAHIKLSAAQKLLQICQNRGSKEFFSRDEMKAMQDSRLGDIFNTIDKHTKFQRINVNDVSEEEIEQIKQSSLCHEESTTVASSSLSI